MPDEPLYGLEYDPYGFELEPAAEQRRKVLARSANLDMAVGALTAYMYERVGGRSCLIAGARGSGKTTLVDRAFEDVKRGPNAARRPIRVRLHGPSLLNPPQPIPTKDDPSPPKISVAEHVIKTLVINLYQTAAEEVSNAFKDYVADYGQDWGEFAAQLRLTLDGAPSAATLRFFWERAGALPGGVLFPRLTSESQRGDDEQFTTNQGMAEIVALATAAEAYRSCAGQYKQEKKDAKSVGDKAETKTQFSASGKEFSQTLIGLATGVSAGATAAALGTSKPTVALAGAITALASMVTLSYTRTRSRETTLKEEVTFLPDLSVSALVHRVVLLLRRLRQAGIIPIFVIDELDKVENPVRPLNELTSSLKFLFADEGFFCFLTDRTYFAEIGRLNRQQVNTQIRTIYTNQMLVRYDTSDIREFLKQVIRPSEDVRDSNRNELEADAEAFRYIVICRSRMLLFEMSRDLAGFSRPDGRLKLAFKAPRENLGHQFHLAVQLAIELVLTNEFVANRISRDANFAQTIYDALYYPVNLWYTDERRVDCSQIALIDGISAITGESLSLEEPDQDFLHTQVKAVLELIADLPYLEERLRAAFRSNRLVVADGILGRLLDAIPKEIRLLKAVPGAEDVYQWDYNRSGIPYEASVIQDIQDNRPLWDAYATIGALVKSVAEIVARRSTVDEVLSGLSEAESVTKLLAGLLIPIGANS
ncbi:hypothetical protein EDE15_3556 [Edaphobacter aggregans]|uniref:Uncharacterized protein n=1 Tax=Edaphobacter aggregans TaxID=570835 RepID=A0A428MME9_9BACT|nr:hypothetical protein [Edaphobacter aggregans]RSL18002.1 hypothetical protein EDE15_3556 [Edaphobacter aggregans]